MRTFVASNNDALSLELVDLLQGAGHECLVSKITPLELVGLRLTQSRPELLVVAMSPDPEQGLALMRSVRGTLTGRVLAIGPAHESKLLLRALREGADQYLDEADPKTELETVLSLLQIQAAAPTSTGRLVSILAPSGGSGCSTLAANIATILAREHKSCLLLDLNLGGGDLASLLDLRPTHTLAELCQNSAEMDRAIFERCLAKHENGVALLSPPRSFSEIGKVTKEGIRDILTMGRAVYPYVVADLDDYFHQEQTQTMRLSDQILLVLRLDFTSLRNARRTLEHLEQMGLPRDRVRLVVNRYGQPKELPAAKAEEALNMKIAHYIPDDPKTINRANNSGIPAVLESPSAKVSKNIQLLAQSVNGQHKSR